MQRIQLLLMNIGNKSEFHDTVHLYETTNNTLVDDE